MPLRIKSEVILKIKYLRSQGRSLPEISRELTVSRTTVLRYIKGVDILPEYLHEWAGKRGGSRKRMFLREAEALKEARLLVKYLSSKEKLLFLSALYWAEGNKKDLILTNTDPNLIRVFMNAVRDVLNINEDRFQVSIRIYEDIDREKSLSFWSKVTRIPKDKFISVHILPGKKSGKLEFGMCRVRIAKGSDILKRIIGVNKVVTDLLNIDSFKSVTP